MLPAALFLGVVATAVAVAASSRRLDSGVLAAVAIWAAMWLSVVVKYVRKRRSGTATVLAVAPATAAVLFLAKKMSHVSS